jgi:hypothetical protein
MARKITSPVKLVETNVLDYPSQMSEYEKESLAAEAQLAEERRKAAQRKAREVRQLEDMLLKTI